MVHWGMLAGLNCHADDVIFYIHRSGGAILRASVTSGDSGLRQEPLDEHDGVYEILLNFRLDMKTQSEKLFEDFCKRKDIDCKPISVRSSRTPDYCISVNGTEIVVEVKEFSPNKEDEEMLRKAVQKKGIVMGGPHRPGERVRRKIAKSAKQISNLSKGKYPGMLVLYSSIISINPLNEYEMKVAMFGLDSIVVSVPNSMNNMPEILGKKSGPKKKLTPNHNTSMSAIAVFTDSSGIPNLTVYHNHHAAIKIPPTVFKKVGCQQFMLSNNNKGEFPSWLQL